MEEVEYVRVTKNTKNCVLCSRYTNNRKNYIVTVGRMSGRTGVICNYCKAHGRMDMNICMPVEKE